MNRCRKPRTESMAERSARYGALVTSHASNIRAIAGRLPDPERGVLDVLLVQLIANAMQVGEADTLLRVQEADHA